MNKFERGELLNRNVVYSGRIVTLVVDDIRVKGKKTLREVVHHPGGVGILAEVEPDRIPLVRQHRYPVERDVLEIPAGKIEPGEDPGMVGRSAPHGRLQESHRTPAHAG